MLCILTCTAWAEELAMIWLHGVDNKVHVTGREAGEDPGFSNRGGAKSFNMCMQRIFRPRIAWHQFAWQWHECRKNGCAFIVRLACVYVRSVCDNFCPRSNRMVVARRPHGGRMFTCHHLPLLCDQTDHRQVFEHVQKPNFERTFTCGYYSDRTNAVRLTYVYLRSLTTTCRNHP